MRVLSVHRDGWETVLAAVQRQGASISDQVRETVERIIQQVREQGDGALVELGQRFDCPDLTDITVSDEEWQAAGELPPGVRRSLEHAADAIREYHAAQVRSSWFRASGGRITGQLLRPLERVGVYVPGGRAVYPSSVLMCAIPASVAGVAEIVLTTPVGKDGRVPASVLYAARLAGIRQVFKVGGAQAVAALALGTQSVPRVEKIVGPGNVYVCAAKRALWGTVDMDMLAGPSEVCVVADETANPAFVAADLLTQVEHDTEAAAFFLTPDESLIQQVTEELRRQLATLERRHIAETALATNSVCVETRTLEEAVELANACAPEHLSLQVRDPLAWIGHVRNAGAVLLGHYTPQTVGDYIAGPSHTLPTGGSARFWSPLSVDGFVKKTSLISYDREALLAAAPDLDELTRVEGFGAHGRAVRIRFDAKDHGEADGRRGND